MTDGGNLTRSPFVPSRKPQLSRRKSTTCIAATSDTDGACAPLRRSRAPRMHLLGPARQGSGARGRARVRVGRSPPPAGSMWGEAGFRRYFFFQAEDGIRDYKVTGVQTCALPI